MGRDVRIASSTTPTTVSIHAPTWGATSEGYTFNTIYCFNPRAHVGRDRAMASAAQQKESFNPRAHVGRDLQRLPTKRKLKFQSTRPRGARLTVGRVNVRYFNSFNPRAHVGRDRRRALRPFLHFLFQSTRPRGARLDAADLINWAVDVSIHAPTWGATSPGQIKQYISEFQSTRPRGARPKGDGGIQQV